MRWVVEQVSESSASFPEWGLQGPIFEGLGRAFSVLMDSKSEYATNVLSAA